MRQVCTQVTSQQIYSCRWIYHDYPRESRVSDFTSATAVLLGNISIAIYDTGQLGQYNDYATGWTTVVRLPVQTENFSLGHRLQTAAGE